MAAAASPAWRASSASAVAKKPHDDPMRARTPTPADSDCSSDSIVSFRASRCWRRETMTRASAYSAPAARAPSTAATAGSNIAAPNPDGSLEVGDEATGEDGGVGQVGPAGPEGLTGLLQDRVVGRVSGRLEGQQLGGNRRDGGGHRTELGPHLGQVLLGVGGVTPGLDDGGGETVGQFGEPVGGSQLDVGEHDAPRLGDGEDVDPEVGDDPLGIGPQRRLVVVALNPGAEAGEPVDLLLELGRESGAVVLAQLHDRFGGGEPLPEGQDPAG